MPHPLRLPVILLLILLPLPALANNRLASALNLLDGDELPEEHTARLKPWPAGGKDLWVVAAVYGSQDDARIQAAVLRERAGRFTLVAKSEGDGEEPVSGEPVHSFDLELDLIPYRISPSVTAFGVRFQNSYNSTARASSYEALHLYRVDGKRLVPIFAELTYESYVEKAQDESADNLETTSASVVILSKQKHNGFFDLILREKTSRMATTYRWNGERYEAESARSH